MSNSTARPRMLQAMGRAFAKVGAKYNDQRMLEAAQRLLAASQQPMEGTAMTEKQTDIVERPSRQMQALSRAVERVGIKHSDPKLMQLAQELAGSQPMEVKAMSEKQSDIVARLRDTIDQDRNIVFEAADEIERLRALVKELTPRTKCDHVWEPVATSAIDPITHKRCIVCRVIEEN